MIMNYQDFISKIGGESGYKIECIFNTIRELNKETNKETLLIINEIEKVIPTRDNTVSLLPIEKTNSILGEFGGIYDNHTIFIIGITNNVHRIDKLALVPGRFGSAITVKASISKSLEEVV
jgi:SpoVK/Ycf46/Vps4 family AAA+-type ATPase